MLKFLTRPVQTRWDVAVGAMWGYLMAFGVVMIASVLGLVVAGVVMALLGAGAGAAP